MRLPTLPSHSTVVQHVLGHQSPWLLRECAVLILLTLLGSLGHTILQGLITQSEIDSLRQQTVEIDAKGALLAPEVVKKTASKAAPNRSRLTSDNALTEEQRRNLNTVIRQLNTPWQDLFNQLERDTPKEVALISIEPDARRASIRLQAEAKTLDTLLAYAASLQQRGVLGRLTYSKHETNEQDSNKPVRLSVDIELRMPQRLAGTDTAATAPPISPSLEITK
jgi:Tfp pilus assembly protein PilN